MCPGSYTNAKEGGGEGGRGGSGGGGGGRRVEEVFAGVGSMVEEEFG